MTTQTDEPENRKPLTFPGMALGSAAGAVLALVGVAAVTRYLGGNAIGMEIGAAVMLLAAALLVFPATRLWALLLAWNGLGIGCALLLIGIFSVGALMAFPLVLIALTLSSWPRDNGEPIASGPAIVAQVGGFLLVFALYGLLGNVLRNLLRLAGW